MELNNETITFILNLLEMTKKAKGFPEALKKLQNLSAWQMKEFMLNDFCDRRGKNNVLRLISYPRILTIESLQGDELLREGCKVDLDTKYGLRLVEREKGAPTKKIHVRVDETFGQGTALDAFASLPGGWRHKYLTWNQIIAFLRKYPKWVNQSGVTHFLCIKDELKEVDESQPGDNLFEFMLHADLKRDPPRSSIDCRPLDFVVTYPNKRRVVSPSRIDAYLSEDFKRQKPLQFEK